MTIDLVSFLLGVLVCALVFAAITNSMARPAMKKHRRRRPRQ